MCHCALVSCTPWQSIRLFWGVRYSAVECRKLFLLLIAWCSSISSWYWWLLLGFLGPLFLCWTTRFGFLRQSSSGSAEAHLPGCFRSWTFPLNSGLNMLPSDSFMSCLDSLLGYSTRGFQALQLIVLWCLVPQINHLPAVCRSLFGNLVHNDGGFVCLT